MEHRFDYTKPDLGFAELGWQFQEEGDWGQAVAMYREALSLLPNEPDLWFDYAVSLCGMDRLKAALKAIRQAIDLDDQVADYWFCIGNIYRKLSWLRLAEEAYWKALALEQDHSDSMNNLSLVFFRQGKYSQAAQILLRAASVVPQDSVVRFNLGDTYEMLGLAAAALEEYRTAFALSPTYTQALEKLIDLTREAEGDSAVFEMELHLDHLRSLGYGE